MIVSDVIENEIFSFEVMISIFCGFFLRKFCDITLNLPLSCKPPKYYKLSADEFFSGVCPWPKSQTMVNWSDFFTAAHANPGEGRGTDKHTSTLNFREPTCNTGENYISLFFRRASTFQVKGSIADISVAHKNFTVKLNDFAGLIEMQKAFFNKHFFLLNSCG